MTDRLNQIAAALESFQARKENVDSSRRILRAAVALILRERGDGLEVFVIKRSNKPKDPWSGHMALPGGREEPGDDDLYDTARRETIEEVGMDIADGKFLGQLDDMGPRRSGGQLVVSTVVIDLDTEPGRIDKREVEEAFWVPVGELVDEHVEIPDFPGEWPAYTYKDRYVIWGLTHRILTRLWDLTGQAPPA